MRVLVKPDTLMGVTDIMIICISINIILTLFEKDILKDIDIFKRGTQITV